MPSAENGYSVSNFIIEYVMSIHNKFGMKEAEKVVTELLADVPTIESARWVPTQPGYYCVDYN